MVLAIGVIVFMAGCGYAIYRDIEDERSQDLRESSESSIDTVLIVYGQRSGAISLGDLRSDPSALEIEGAFGGKVALIRITMYDDQKIEIKVPSEKDFDDHPRTMVETSVEIVPVDLGNGMIIPAEMEVVLYG